MHRKGKLGLLASDGRFETEIDDLCSGWLLPPVHDGGAIFASDIEIQPVEWAGREQINITTGQQSLKTRQPSPSPSSNPWIKMVEFFQGCRINRTSQSTD